ncbi:hypothetical protein SDJN02_24469, partial [Cucurbita argyrosperma subsp. argyrosperma]
MDEFEAISVSFGGSKMALEHSLREYGYPKYYLLLNDVFKDDSDLSSFFELIEIGLSSFWCLCNKDKGLKKFLWQHSVHYRFGFNNQTEPCA